MKVKPLSEVQALLGHATTTMRYVHSVPGQRDAELLGAAFASADGAADRGSSSVARPWVPTGEVVGPGLPVERVT